MSKNKKPEQKCLKGINYGSFDMSSEFLRCLYQEGNIFKVPFEKIENCSSINKNEVLVELNTNDANDEAQTLCEFRFFIPNNQAEGISEKVTEKLDSKKGKEDHKVITVFEELKFLTPRGKHSVTFYEKSMKFHGGTFNYKCEFKNIWKVYLLPEPKTDILNFVFSFKQPLRQGSTKHNFFLLQFEKEKNFQIKLQLSEKELKEKYSEPLMEEYNEPGFEIFTKIFKVLSNINIIIPGNFKNIDGDPCIKCSLKNTAGNLFFLQKSLLFLPKASIYFKLDEIKQVEFQRMMTGAKTFDMEITKKDQTFSAAFFAIDRKEQELVEKYFTSRNIPILISKESVKIDQDDYEDDEEGGEGSKKKSGDEDDDDEDDESFHAEDSNGSADDEVGE